MGTITLGPSLPIVALRHAAPLLQPVSHNLPTLASRLPGGVRPWLTTSPSLSLGNPTESS